MLVIGTVAAVMLFQPLQCPRLKSATAYKLKNESMLYN
jgi:hypothetical protein